MCQNHQKCLKQCLDQTPAINSGVEGERTQLEITMGPNSSRCSITLATYLATDWRCSWWCIHALFQDWFWISMCSAICANTQWSYNSSTAILFGLPCCMGYISVQFAYAYSNMLHEYNVDYVGRGGRKVMSSYQHSSAEQKSFFFLSSERLTFYQFKLSLSNVETWLWLLTPAKRRAR